MGVKLRAFKEIQVDWDQVNIIGRDGSSHEASVDERMDR